MNAHLKYRGQHFCSSIREMVLAEKMAMLLLWKDGLVWKNFYCSFSLVWKMVIGLVWYGKMVLVLVLKGWF